MKRYNTRFWKITLALLVSAALTVSAFAPAFAEGAAGNGNGENILHYWSFEGNLDDASGSLGLTADDAYFDNEGKHGKALDVINGSPASSATIPHGTVNGFTMGAWFSLNSGATEWNIIMSKGDTSDTRADRFQVHIGHASEDVGGGYLLAYVPAVGPTMSHEEDGQFVPYDTWTHVAVTFNGASLKMYINGELAIEKEAVGQLDESSRSMNTVTVGALNHDGRSLAFDGLIDDAFYANYPMTAEDIKAAFAGTDDLNAWAKGEKTIVPGEVVRPEEPTEAPSEATPEPASLEPGEAKGQIFFWPFEYTTEDMSHLRLNIDTEESVDTYVDGKAGKAIEADCTLISDLLPEGFSMTEFTVALWLKWSENSNGTYTVPFAVSGKETAHHFEIYYTIDDDNGKLAFYGTANGLNVEKIADVVRDEYFHVAAVNGPDGFRLYLNGEEVYKTKQRILMNGLGDAEDFISLCGLNDRSLTCAGEYDELVVACYAMDEGMIQKLYSDPAGAREDIMKLVESQYPEGYVAPTAVTEPTATPTAAPATATPEPAPTDVPAETESGEQTDPTADPGKDGGKTDGKKANKWVVLAVISGVVIAGCAVAAVLLLKKKK